MRFRWKLMILLLLIALVPMTAMRFFGKRGVRALSDELVSRSRENLSVNAKKQLQFIVESYSQMLSQKREALEIALAYQGDEIERNLAQDRFMPAAVFFAEDFDSGRNVPGDLNTTANHFRILAENKMELIQISYSAQVFNLAPGTSSTAVSADIERLAHLTPIYMRLSEYLKNLVTWHYVAFDNGLYTAYPAHGGFPAGYDPRKQRWYVAASDLSSFWTDQFVDADTGQNVIAVSRPIKGPNGKSRGVTALIIPIRNLLERRLLLENIPSQTRSFVAYLTTQPTTGKRGIRVVVQEGTAEDEHGGWRTPFDADWLVADDDAQNQAVLDDFENGIANIRRIDYRGCDCLWVYGPIHQQSFLMLITPYNEIMKPALAAEEYIQFQIQKLITLTSYTIAGIFIVIVVLALAFSRSVTRPLHILAEGARRLAQGQLDTQVEIKSRDEFGDMARVFNSMGPRLEENYQLRKSLDLAMEVQQNLLPKSDPQVNGLDIAGNSDYCEETGGDYYDYFQVGEDKAGVVVGDVSGHGISAALLMTTARALLRQRTSMPGSIKAVISDVNRQLTEDTEASGHFMTLFYGEINRRENIFQWVRAGHDAAFLYDVDAGSMVELAGGGLPLGVSAETEYEQLKCQIKPGQIIAIGTDGIWETLNPQGKMFGKEKLLTIIQTHAGRSARDIIDAVTAALDDFRYPQKTRSDDITLMVIKVEEAVA